MSQRLATIYALILSAVACFPFRAQRRRRQRRAAAGVADIRTDDQGIRVETGSAEYIAWTQVRKVTLDWEQNPWGDPQFGAYCDTDWVLHGEHKTLRITESVGDTNNAVLLPAMRAHLPGFQFEDSSLKQKYGERLFDLEGGSALIWQRDVP